MNLILQLATLGDVNMVVSGVPEENECHATELADMSLDIIDAASSYIIPHLPEQQLQVAIGIHSGSVVSGIKGQFINCTIVIPETIVS